MQKEKGVKLMNFLKRVRWIYLFLSAILIAIGVFLLMWQELSISLACYAVAGGAAIFGLAKLVTYFVRHVESMVEQYDLSLGIICLAVSALFVLQPVTLLDLIPQILGGYILLDSIFKLQVAMDARRLGSGGWLIMLLGVLICGAWGVSLIVQPEMLVPYKDTLLAGGLIADGVLNLLAVLFIAVTVKKPGADGGIISGSMDGFAERVEPTADSRIPTVTEVVPVEPEPHSDLPSFTDLIDDARAKTNAPEGKGGIFSFFKRNKSSAEKSADAAYDVDYDDYDDEGDIY